MQKRADDLAVYGRMALGRETCDLALVHANVVDVFGGTILEDATVLVGKGRVVAVLSSEDSGAPDARSVVDCKGHYLLPGLMDAHLHIESTMLTPERFAEAVLPLGTTRVVADPHEIANVSGAEGIRYMLEASSRLPMTIHLALPSCVPCTPFEEAGAVLSAADLAPFFAEERVAALGEVMNCPGVLAQDGDLLSKIAEAHAAGRVADGHSPGLLGRSLQAYAASGVANDHECTCLREMEERIRSGMYVFIREGSASKDLATLARGVTPANARRCCFCTDDFHVKDCLAEGHINVILRKAVALGIPATQAVAMATINSARAFGLRGVGAVAPGYVADLCLVDSLENFDVERVFVKGEEVVRFGRLLHPIADEPVPAAILASVHAGCLDTSMFRISVPGGRARVIGLRPHSLITKEEVLDVAVDGDGVFQAEKNPGLCKIAVIERHRGLGHVGLGILDGYVRKGAFLGGAIATSIAHDSHNIVVAGDTDADMLIAVETVASMQGGIALVAGGQILEQLPLPVAGLMSREKPEVVAKTLLRIHLAAERLQVSHDIDPVMTLSFMPLCVIPSLKLNTRGLFDVNSFSFVPLVP